MSMFCKHIVNRVGIRRRSYWIPSHCLNRSGMIKFKRPSHHHHWCLLMAKLIHMSTLLRWIIRWWWHGLPTPLSVNSWQVPLKKDMWWYMSLPRFSVVRYQDLTKKMVQHFLESKHRKVSIIGLFNIQQGYSEYLREYLARFNEETIKVSHPNQDMFVGWFNTASKSGSSTNP